MSRRAPTKGRLRARDRFGKYRIVRTLGSGGFATVYEATDSIEGLRVALKVPHAHLVDEQSLGWFREEIRTLTRLDHPGILPLKNAEFVDEVLVMVHPLGLGTLTERLRRRLSLPRFVHFAQQMVDAVAHAHESKVIHCDIKPDNFILFPGDRIRLTDFGIARVSQRTIDGSGSGTLGYMAPDQAMGKASTRSDVFSLGLVWWEMLTHEVPTWPFRWPPPGGDRLKRRISTGFMELLRRSMAADPELRFPDAVRLREAFSEAAANIEARGRPGRASSAPASIAREEQRRFSAFQRQHREALQLHDSCRLCSGPVAESMQLCPWCGGELHFAQRETRLPARCDRCHRGRKLDWRYCAWCHGPGFEEVSARAYSDRRYRRRCEQAGCRGLQLPFSRYCPWCRAKVRRPWTIPGLSHRCPGCRSSVDLVAWRHCPWCTRKLPDPPIPRRSR